MRKGVPEVRERVARAEGPREGAVQRGFVPGLQGRAAVVSCRAGPVSSGRRARAVQAGSSVRRRALAASASERCP